LGLPEDMKWAMALLEAHNISESIKPNKPNNNIIIIITKHVKEKNIQEHVI
jgi:hypothetical protein